MNNSTSPLISVVIPVYNSEMFLKQCIDSILWQTYDHWELILVDDGSTDNSGAILDEYAAKDTRIEAFHIDNQGALIARMYGVSQTEGEAVCFVDSDDYIDPDALEIFMKYYSDDIDILVCSNKTGTIGRVEYLEQILNRKLWGTMCEKLYKRHLFTDEVFSAPKGIVMGEDMLFNVRITEKLKRVDFIKEHFYNYDQRSNQQSVSHKWEGTWEYAEYYLYELERAIRFMDMQKFEPFLLARQRLWNIEDTLVAGRPVNRHSIQASYVFYIHRKYYWHIGLRWEAFILWLRPKFVSFLLLRLYCIIKIRYGKKH